MQLVLVKSGEKGESSKKRDGSLSDCSESQLQVRIKSLHSNLEKFKSVKGGVPRSVTSLECSKGARENLLQSIVQDKSSRNPS
jgi:hypothetical protein